MQLIAALAFIGDISAYHLTVLGHHLTTAQLSGWRPLVVAVAVASALVVIALWLWMARTVGQGRNWARIACAVLAGLAMLELTGTPQRGAIAAGHADLADRPGRGMAALAPGRQRVLQAHGQAAVTRRHRVPYAVRGRRP